MLAGTKELSNDVRSGLNVLTNLRGERACRIFYGQAGRSLLQENINRLKSVCGPGQPVRKRTSRTGKKDQARNMSDVHTGAERVSARPRLAASSGPRLGSQDFPFTVR